MSISEPVEGTFHGVLPAIVTPVDEAGEFAEKVFERLLADVYQVGMRGVYVCGNTGEGPLQSVSMRQQVAEASVRCSPKGKAVIIHVGGVRLPEAIQLARHAERIGSTAVSALPPAGSYNFRELHHYYQQLAAACDLPFLVYYFPDLCRAIETLDQILELCEIPNVAGLKFTDFDLFKLHQVGRAGKVIFNGRDQVLAAGLLMGASGGIGSFYNVIPQLFVDLYAYARNGQWEEARRIQDRINELIRITSRFPTVSATKTMLKWRGYDCGRCIAPHENLTETGELQLRELVKQSSFCNEIVGPSI
jgi:N-acetylneuraminate lyase